MSTSTMTTVAPLDQLPSKISKDAEIKSVFHPAFYQGGYEFKYKPLNSSSTTQAFINKSKFTKDDTSLLMKSPAAAATTAALQKLHKSHSYSETLRPKATIIKEDSFNARIATSPDAESEIYDAVDDDANVRYQRTTNTNTKASAFIIQRDAKNAFSCLNNINNNNSCHNNNKNYDDNGGDDDDDDDSEVVFINTTSMDNSASCGDGFGGINIDDQDEDACLLLPADSQSLSNISPSRRAAALNNSRRSNARSSACYRLHAFITRNWYLSYLVPLSILLALMLVAYLTRDYAKRLLYWIETQNPWIIFAIFMLLFIIVSFPIIVGYFVLMITSGYLFGFFKGLLTVILGANFGIALAHVCIHNMRHRIPMHRLIKNETGRAILRVISGPRAFRVVLFTRLTPLPFGLQNAIFGVSSINPRVYHAATFLGLLPAQTINVYLGSTLRSMHEVLNSHGTAVTGYISFGIEVICGVVLMFWVVQKARKELSETLLDCSSTDSKIINIQV